MRLLIAEDDRASRAILEHIARNWDYVPLVASDGQEAWEILNRPDAPELALLDWEMPGLSGVEICRRMRERPGGPGTHLILLTSKAQSEDVVAGLAAGADDYLTKPYNRSELRARLNAGQRISELQASLANRLDEIEETLLSIQESFLCGHVPADLPGLEVEARTVAHGQVAGDFYDFHRHGDKVLDVVVGDVMGKGMRASLLGAALATRFLRCLREHTVTTGSLSPPPLSRFLANVRTQAFPQFMGTESFATVCYVRIDRNRDLLELVDWGHPSLIHVSAQTGKAELVRGSNMPMGFSQDEEPIVVSRPLEDGDVFVLYSDGITEATNAEGRMYGEERLAQCVREHAGIPLPDLVDAIMADMVRHVAGARLADDVTCVAIRVCPRLQTPEESGMTEFERTRRRQDVPVVVGDAEGVVVEINDAFSKAFGWSRDQLVGACMTQIIPEGMHDAHTLGFSRLVTTNEGRLLGQPLDLPIRLASGEERAARHTITAERRDSQWLFAATIVPLVATDGGETDAR